MVDPAVYETAPSVWTTALSFSYRSKFVPIIGSRSAKWPYLTYSTGMFSPSRASHDIQLVSKSVPT